MLAGRTEDEKCIGDDVQHTDVFMLTVRSKRMKRRRIPHSGSELFRMVRILAYPRKILATMQSRFVARIFKQKQST